MSFIYYFNFVRGIKCGKETFVSLPHRLPNSFWDSQYANSVHGGRCELMRQLETSTSTPRATARAFELLKVGSFKFPPPWAKVMFKCPTLKPGGVLGSIFAGYVPLASPKPYPIIVYSVANYRPHVSHFWANIPQIPNCRVYLPLKSRKCATPF